MRRSLSDLIVWGCYALFGVSVLLTLTIGPEAFLSLGWVLDLVGGVLSRLWHEQPLVSGSILVSLGILVGIHFEKDGPKA